MITFQVWNRLAGTNCFCFFAEFASLVLLPIFAHRTPLAEFLKRFLYNKQMAKVALD